MAQLPRLLMISSKVILAILVIIIIHKKNSLTNHCSQPLFLLTFPVSTATEDSFLQRYTSRFARDFGEGRVRGCCLFFTIPRVFWISTHESAVVPLEVEFR